MISATTHSFNANIRVVTNFISHYIKIVNRVWVEANVSILTGVTVGDNVVVAAEVLVTKEVLANALVGDVTAKIIKMIENE